MVSISSIRLKSTALFVAIFDIPCAIPMLAISISCIHRPRGLLVLTKILVHDDESGNQHQWYILTH